MTAWPAIAFDLPWQALVAGLALGGLHFGGLWLTLSSLSRASRPVRLLAMSTAARVTATAAGLLCLLEAGGWRWLLTGLVGLLMGRMSVGWYAWRRQAAAPAPHWT